MAESRNLFSTLIVLIQSLSRKRRRSLLPLIALMLLGAFAELATIGSLVPFLALVAEPSGQSVAGPFGSLFAQSSEGNALSSIYAVTVFFALAALIAAALRLSLQWLTSSFVEGVACELATKIYENILHRPYAYHIQNNSSRIIANISKVETLSSYLIAPLMAAITGTIIATFIIAGLVIIDPTAAVVAGGGFSCVYFFTTTVTRSRLRRNSRLISDAQSSRVKAMQEGVGGIRDVLLDQSQSFFVDEYRRSETKIRDARIWNAFYASAPRFLVEALGMIVIAVLAVIVTGRSGGLAEAIPILGALALGAQRLLPLIQQVYNGWAQAMGNRQVLLDVVSMLDEATRYTGNNSGVLPFERELRLAHVSYSYSPQRMPALRDVNLSVLKGSRIGIAGKTGSGKSTLMDILLGLLEPTSGHMYSDGIEINELNRAAWQQNIAHVPQAIYLADASIAENIAFGVSPSLIDFEGVHRAAEQAELSEVISALPQGYHTKVGERGIQLSGGQRQRIGIARALYKKATVLVLDEATSALDNETEAAVMSAISRLDRDLTIFIIAHRLSTLQKCDRIIVLDAGGVSSHQLDLQNSTRDV